MGTVTVTFEERDITVPAEPGETVLAVARREDVGIASYCGGQGICKQCEVVITGGEVKPKDPQRWQATPLPDGQGTQVLACQAVITEDITVRIPVRSQAEDFAIEDVQPLAGELVDLSRFGPLTPLTQQFVLQLSQPSRDDTATDFDRLAHGLAAEQQGLEPVTTDLELLRELPIVLRQNEFEVAVAITDMGPTRSVAAVRPPEAAQRSIGLAIDVGTSTVAVQLVALETGEIIAGAMRRNAQIAYGEDVISRIIWTQQHDNGLTQMYGAIHDTLNEMADYLYDQCDVDADEVMAVAVAGNATMINFLWQIDARPIRRTPHVPVASTLPVVQSRQLGLRTHPRAAVFCHPAVSGFVGGDITAGILAAGIHKSEGLSLLVDVGTNGEIVIGNQDWLMGASCSAGPAFEGVGVKAAMPATAGAITTLDYDPETDTVQYQTIGDQAPRGICGTGLVEMIATLAQARVIDRTGSIDPHFPSPRVREGKGEAEFVLVWPEEAVGEEPITIYQHDIDNLLRSKAAVLAGITVLLDNLGLQATDVTRMYLAGAFGAGLDVEKAVAIGLLPDIPRDRIQVVGNSALAGAYLTLMSQGARREANQIAASLTYVDLSTEAEFMDEFIASNFIPHTDLSRFPTVATGD